MFDALSEADAWVKSNRSETAHFLSVESGLPLSTTIRFLERRTAGPITRLKDGDIADQQRVADTFAQLGLSPKPIRVSDAVLKA